MMTGATLEKPASGTGAGRSRALALSGSPLLLAELAVLGGLLTFALQLRLANLEHFTGSFDEGIRAMQLLLMDHGYRPYRDIFASQGPLLLDLLYPFYVFFGRTLGAIRLGVGLMSLLGLLGAWWAGRAISPLAGLATAALLAVSPGYLEGSRLALAEVPSLAPCLWGVGCGLRWLRGGATAWLYSAVALGVVGLLIKPMALAALAPLAVLIVARRDWKARTIVGPPLVGLAIVGMVLLALGAERVLEVLRDYRVGALRPPGSSALENWSLMTKVLGNERPGFVVLALTGLALGLLTWRSATAVLASWPLAQCALFLAYTDLSDKHVVYLVPSLALLGGLAVAGAVTATRRGRLFGAQDLLLMTVGALGAIVFYAWSVPALWRADRALLRDDEVRIRRDYAGTQEQAALMASLAGPDDFVLTDHPYAAFLAGRQVPPWLSDTSGTRIDAGSLNAEVAIREASWSGPKVVVTWRRRLGKLEEFNRWLAQDYRFLKTYPGSDPANPLRLYVRAELEEGARALLSAPDFSR
jgi:hypothetical protein